MSCEGAALSFQANANYRTWSIDFELDSIIDYSVDSTKIISNLGAPILFSPYVNNQG